MLDPCSCGEPHPHVVMKRQTADGVFLSLWSDGAVTGTLGGRIGGVPVVRSRTPEGQRAALVAGRLLLGEACIYGVTELGEVYAAARRAAAKDGLPGTLRAELRRERERPHRFPLRWVVMAADRSGKPTERFARLPRMRWPGRGVFDFCGGPGSAGGRYVLAHRMNTGRRSADETWDTSTGLRFRRLDDLFQFLAGEGV